MSRRLTKNRLEAITEALASRLSGEFAAEFGPEYDGQDREAYEGALDWAQDELLKRRTKNVERLRARTKNVVSLKRED